MKVLVISAAFPPLRAGEADHTLHLCTHLSGPGIDLHLLTTKGHQAPPGLPFTLWPLMATWSWTELPRLARFIRRSAPDAVLLIYSGWIYNDHPMITFAATITRRLLPKACFVTQMEIGAGSSWRGLGARIVRKAAGRLVGARHADYSFGTLLRDSHRLIVLSELHRAGFSGLAPEVDARIAVIPPPSLIKRCPGGPLARARGRAGLGARDHEFLLAFFGYTDGSKGIEALFKAVEIVSRRSPRVRLVMVGGGRGTSAGGFGPDAERVRYDEEIQAMPQQLGIHDKVTWTQGFGSDSDEGSMYLQAADAAVLPFVGGVTLNRSSFAAAAAHGLPIVTTRGSALESPFRDGDNVLLVPPNDAGSLAAAIQSLMDDAALRERLGQGALGLAREWFAWERTIERTLEALQDPYARGHRRAKPPSDLPQSLG